MRKTFRIHGSYIAYLRYCWPNVTIPRAITKLLDGDMPARQAPQPDFLMQDPLVARVRADIIISAQQDRTLRRHQRLYRNVSPGRAIECILDDWSKDRGFIIVVPQRGIFSDKERKTARI